MKKAVKKIAVLMLASTMVLSFEACGAPAAKTNGDASSSSQSQASSDDSHSTPDSSSSQSSQADEQSEEKLGEFKTDATITETVLVDEKGVKITATGLEYTDYSAELKLSIENNSGKKLSFESGGLAYCGNAVNGYMIEDGYLNSEVGDGKKANESVSFSFQNMMIYGIDEIADIELGIEISSDDYKTYISPVTKQVKTSAFDNYDYSVDYYQERITSRAAMNTYDYTITHFSKDSLYDEKGIKMLSNGLMVNKDGETAVLLELENTTSSAVKITTANIVINGLVVDTFDFSYDEINAGKRSIIDVKISSALKSEFWDVYGIKEIGSISFAIKQSDPDGNYIADEKTINIVVPGIKAEFDSTGKEIYNKDGFKIISKAVIESPSDYLSNMYAMFIVENKSGKTISIDDQDDSLSINGVMSDYILFSEEIENDTIAVLKIELDESSLKENKITSAADIKEIEVGLEIEDDNDNVDEPTIKVSYE